MQILYGNHYTLPVSYCPEQEGTQLDTPFIDSPAHSMGLGRSHHTDNTYRTWMAIKNKDEVKLYGLTGSGEYGITSFNLLKTITINDV